MVLGWLLREGILHLLMRRHPLSSAGLLSLGIRQFLLLHVLVCVWIWFSGGGGEGAGCFFLDVFGVRCILNG